jgi:hypothetical protein
VFFTTNIFNMKNCLFYLVILNLLLSCSCSSGNRITIKSAYKGTLDSVTVRLFANKVATAYNLYYGMDTAIYFHRKDHNSHDVSMYVILYKHGKKVDSLFHYNDLSFVTADLDIVITDSMKLRYNVKRGKY